MLPANSPPPSLSPSRYATLHRLQRLFRELFRRTKGFLHIQTLPYVANKACATFLDASDRNRQKQCRQILGRRLELNPHQLHHFLHTPMGEAFLTWCGQFFHIPRDHNPASTLQDLLLQMTADPEGLSLLSLLRRSPTLLQLNTDQLLFTAQRVEWLWQATHAAIAQIRELANAEAAADSLDLAACPDLTQLGPFQVQQFQRELPRSHPIDPRLPGSVSLSVWCYQPVPWPEGAVPVVVQSHGLASSPDDLAPYAYHLASHGYFVVAPQHPGSDVDQVRRMLMGEATDVFQMSDFLDRPQVIHELLDYLEQWNAIDFEGKLQLQSVGLMGYSFGAYTAFALAGATIQFSQLEQACIPAIAQPNISLLLQCQALGLPRQTYHFHDQRIKAIVSIDAVGSELFGSEGVAHVQIPVLLLAGSHDAAAPLVFEQLRLFQWLTTAHAYLAVMQGKSHLRDAQRFAKLLNLQINIFPKGVTPKAITPPFEGYINALSLAFWQQHLLPDRDSPSWLTASYSQHLSHPPFDMCLISQASRPALQTRFPFLDRTDSENLP